MEELPDEDGMWYALQQAYSDFGVCGMRLHRHL